ncbi:Rho guanine nucleotide exchange factor 8 [Asimina triloba]
MELMKERFTKLLLGEDMSGGGKGVSSALALSNAITNLAASVFGEQWRLEPMSAERKARWRKEVDWLLSVTDHIVEFVPSQQTTKDGTNVEIMVTRQRTDLLMNIPALRKLDAMLIEYLDNFKDQTEFWYVSRDSDDSDKATTQRHGDKWWLPTPKVPPEGLSDASRKWLQFQKDSVNQVLKAAMAINAQVLSEMEIPENYIESLPKNGRATLGDAIYRGITDEFFDPELFLEQMDLSTEHKILEFKNKIEASIVIWKRKMNNKDGKSSWGSGVSIEKREIFEDRAETILLLLKHRFPGIPQSSLDISKIQYNRDVGQSVLECYSRVLESLAYTVTSRIDDVLFADSLTQNPTHAESKKQPATSDPPPVNHQEKTLKQGDDGEKPATKDSPSSMTLSDFMGWGIDAEQEAKKEPGNLEDMLSMDDGKTINKPTNIAINKKVTYIEKLENIGGVRSPAGILRSKLRPSPLMASSLTPVQKPISKNTVFGIRSCSFSVSDSVGWNTGPSPVSHRVSPSTVRGRFWRRITALDRTGKLAGGFCFGTLLSCISVSIFFIAPNKLTEIFAGKRWEEVLFAVVFQLGFQLCWEDRGKLQLTITGPFAHHPVAVNLDGLDQFNSESSSNVRRSSSVTNASIFPADSKHISSALAPDIPLLSCSDVCSKVLEGLKSSQESRKGKEQFLAMYSSILGGITTDPAVMVIPMDDHMVHRGHGVFDTAAIMDG